MKKIFFALSAATTLSAMALNTKPTLVEKVSPFQKWTKLQSKTIGLLAEEEIAGVCNIDWMYSAKQIDPKSTYPCNSNNVYRYDQEFASPVAVYFKSQGEGFNFLKNWKLEGGWQGDAAMFSSKTPNKWGLSRAAHLVDVQVNDGLGSKGDIHFVITDAKVLDQTAAFPFSPEQILQQFLAPYGKLDSAQSKVLQNSLAKAVTSTEIASADFQKIKSLQRSSPTFAGYEATWLSNQKELRVVYYRRYEDRYSKTVIQPSNCHCTGNPPKCPPCPPPHAVTYTATFGAEALIEARYTKDGKLKSVQRPPVSVYFTGIPAGMF